MICPLCSTSNTDTADHCYACAAPLSDCANGIEQLAPGSMLQQGAYVVNRLLGRGGFGITYLGSDVHLGRVVAIKEFFPAGCTRAAAIVRPSGVSSAADFDNARKRFLEEARTLARFRHPGIVNVFAAFEENNTAYMVMEYLLGTNLGLLVEEQGPLQELDALRYIREAGAALETVHQAGLLHRDVKPENIMLCRDVRVVLIDFGTARDFAIGRTQGHTVVVTPGYAPLEQYAQRAQRGAFSDVYGLGATLFFLLTGEAPVPATDRAAGVEFVPPHRLVSGISPQASDAIRWAMEMKVDARPKTVQDFLNALDTDSPVPNRTISLTTLVAKESLVPARLSDTFYVHTNALDPVILQWPQRCACCGEASDTHHPLDYTPEEVSSRWQSWYVPYCSQCVQHVKAGDAWNGNLFRKVSTVLFITLFLSLVCCAITTSFVPFAVWCIGSFLYAMRLLSRPVPAVTDTLKPTCSTPHAAVTCTNMWHGDGDEIVFTLYFMNPDYLTEFETLNRAYQALPMSGPHSSS